ncbi:hypothetical protein [Chitinophaga caseinilytica]|uniref:DUF3347 domain-containing protein n=1 Tax=Chitinophaga caseinilytica TaxID=2267521 RepID=A0ABZ2YZ84_9BACT
MGSKLWSGGWMILLAAAACTQPVKAPAGEGENPVVEFRGITVPAVLKDSLRGVMDGYKVLSDALAKEDTLLADAAARLMRQRLDSLPLYRSGLDSAHAGALELNAGSISAELTAMVLEDGGLEGRRQSFWMASELLYDLLQQTGPVNGVKYHYWCGEAFGGKGAFWLGDSAALANPYGGKADCAEPRDTIGQWR